MKKKLITELITEHSEITKVLSDLKEVGILSERGREMMIESRDLIVDHLQKEDKMIYPTLRKAADNDYMLAQTLKLFGSEMDHLAGDIMNFYEQYLENTSHNPDQFSKDISKIIVALKNRMMKEEVAIYKAFAGLN